MEDKLNPDKSDPEGDMWTNCIEDSLVDIFTRIWGEAQFPKAHHMRNLSTISEPLHALKWLSQQLYRRRVHLLGSGKECMFEFVERASAPISSNAFITQSIGFLTHRLKE
jgi:hypothetical protein